MKLTCVDQSTGVSVDRTQQEHGRHLFLDALHLRHVELRFFFLDGPVVVMVGALLPVPQETGHFGEFFYIIDALHCRTAAC